PAAVVLNRRRTSLSALATILASDVRKLFPSQAQPVIPCLPHAVPRCEIALVELIAFKNLCEGGFHGQLLTVEDCVCSPNCGGMMGVARCGHGQAAQLRILERERVVAAESRGGIEHFQCVDRERFESGEANAGAK